MQRMQSYLHLALLMAVMLHAIPCLAQSPTVTCDDCSFANPEGNKFCNRCGKELVQGVAKHIGRTPDATVLSVERETLVLSKGMVDGIEKGDRFRIVGIKHAFVNAKGDTVGIEEMAVATLKVRSVSGDNCVASYRGKGGYIPQAGDVAIIVPTSYLSRRVRLSLGLHFLGVDDTFPVGQGEWPDWNGNGYNWNPTEYPETAGDPLLELEVGIHEHFAVGASLQGNSITSFQPSFHFSGYRAFARAYLLPGGVTPYAQIFVGRNNYSYEGWIHMDGNPYTVSHSSSGNCNGWSLGVLAPVSSRFGFFASYGQQTMKFDGPETMTIIREHGDEFHFPLYSADSVTNSRFEMGVSFALGRI